MLDDDPTRPCSNETPKEEMVVGDDGMVSSSSGGYSVLLVPLPLLLLVVMVARYQLILPLLFSFLFLFVEDDDSCFRLVERQGLMVLMFFP